MSKTTVFFMLIIATLACTAAIVTAGVTEIKIYTNENTQRYYGSDVVGPAHAANYLGTKPAGPHVNALVVRIGMNADVDATKTPPDSNSLWVTRDAAMGPYAIKYHFVTMPNPRTWIDIWRDDTPGYTEYLDVSATQRITFWIKGLVGCQYPLWLRIRSQNHPVDGKDVEGARVPIDGETIIRKDAFGYHFAASDVPFNGDWQFVSIPLDFLQLATAAEVQAVIPYSWAGHVEGDHWFGGPTFDPKTIRAIMLDTRAGGEANQGNYPWPSAGQPVGTSDYWLDEIVFTLNEGSGVVDVEGNTSVMPLTYALSDNYPNPFNPTTNIEYAVPVSNHVSIDVYNTLGQKVRTLVDRFVTAGTYKTMWDGRDDNSNILPTGIYFCKMQASHFTSVKKMILTK